MLAIIVKKVLEGLKKSKSFKNENVKFNQKNYLWTILNFQQIKFFMGY